MRSIGRGGSGGGSREVATARYRELGGSAAHGPNFRFFPFSRGVLWKQTNDSRESGRDYESEQNKKNKN
jgi:hypothetical protein